MDRLQQFLTVDDAARQRTALSAMGGGFLVGMAMQLYGASFVEAAYTAAAALSAIFTLKVWSYCRTVPARKAILIREPQFLRRNFIAAAVAAGVLFFLRVISGSDLAAAVLDRRILAQTRDPVLSADNAGKVASTLEIARQWHVILPPTTLIQVRDKIQATANNSSDWHGLSIPASALAIYDREISGSSTTIAREVTIEYARGMGYFDPDKGPSTPGAYEKAVSTITSGIELADGNSLLKARGYILRAFVNYFMGKTNEELADLETAQNLGTLDLGAVFLLEGEALAKSNNPDDLKRAVRLLTLSDQMTSAADPASFHLAVVTQRGLAHYKLGEYRETIQDFESVLPSLPGTHHIVESAYQLIIVSYLRLDDYDDASRTVNEYYSRVGSPESRRWHDTVPYFLVDPQFTVDELSR